MGPGLSLLVTKPPTIELERTLAEAKELNTVGNSAKNISEEELEDGYILTYTVSSDVLGEMHNLVGRRQFGDKVIQCRGSSTTEAGLAAAVTACKSIHE